MPTILGAGGLELLEDGSIWKMPDELRDLERKLAINIAEILVGRRVNILSSVSMR